jgi:AcrR family transcriptional regulator
MSSLDAASSPRIPGLRVAGRRTPLKPRKRPSQARSRETVRAILEAAAHVFEERGPDAATTDAIAERAGVSIGSLYQYFPSKDALLATLSACHLLAARAAMAPAFAALAGQAPADAVIPVLVRAMVEAHAQRPRLHRILFTDAPVPSEHARALANEHRECVGRVAHWLARGDEPDLETRIAARAGFDALLALAHGFVLDRRVGTLAQREAAMVRLLERYWRP